MLNCFSIVSSLPSCLPQDRLHELTSGCFVVLLSLLAIFANGIMPIQYFSSSDALTKEKSQGYLFRSVLKCIPYLIEEVGRSDRITEIIPQHGISTDPGVREEAVQVLNRIVSYLPHRRFAVMRGMANFILQLPDEFPLLIQTSLGRLLELMRFWRSCLNSDLEFRADDTKHGVQRNNGFKKSSFHQSEVTEFRASEIDAVGLIFLSSVDSQIRHTALELLRCVRALRNDIRDRTLRELLDHNLRNEVEPIFVIDVLEEHGVRILIYSFPSDIFYFLIPFKVPFVNFPVKFLTERFEDYRMTLFKTVIGILGIPLI